MVALWPERRVRARKLNVRETNHGHMPGESAASKLLFCRAAGRIVIQYGNYSIHYPSSAIPRVRLTTLSTPPGADVPSKSKKENAAFNSGAARSRAARSHRASVRPSVTTITGPLDTTSCEYRSETVR